MEAGAMRRRRYRLQTPTFLANFSSFEFASDPLLAEGERGNSRRCTAIVFFSPAIYQPSSARYSANVFGS